MSHHHHKKHHHKKQYKNQGEYQLKDNRANVLGYYYSVNPETGKIIQTVDAGGYHYAW
jgi:hypothetical protein